jgi:hypothetical protein
MINLDIARHRLVNQQIAQPASATPSEVVAWLGAIQGQDYAGAKWSIGVRLPGSTDAGIEQAIAAKTIVRTWAMRGTLHLVAAEDLRWLLALLAPRIIAGCARRYHELELDAPTLARSNSVLATALADGTPRSRTVLLELLEANGISTKGQRAAYMLQRASLDGLVCQGAAVRNTPTYMALDESLAQGKLLARDQALAELARRYFTSRGPATLQDFAAWSGLTIADARAGLGAIESQLTQASIGGQTYWMPQGSPVKGRDVYLLPGFDEYLLGYRDRSAVLDPQYASRIVPGGNGVFYPTIICNGRVAGTWKRTVKKDTVIVAPQPFHPLSDAETSAMRSAAAMYGQFLQQPVTIAHQ